MVRLSVFMFAILGVFSPLAARAIDDGPAPFTTYPAFRNSEFSGGAYRVEAVTDKGLMKELIIGCSRGPGIITYSKVEDLYCTPDHRCTHGLRTAIDRLC